MKNIACVILAAGKGTRMKSKIPKALHEIHSRSMLEYLINSVKDAGISKIVLVLGYGAGQIKRRFGDFDIVYQEKLLGSGNAVEGTRKYFQSFTSWIIQSVIEIKDWDLVWLLLSELPIFLATKLT